MFNFLVKYAFRMFFLVFVICINIWLHVLTLLIQQMFYNNVWTCTRGFRSFLGIEEMGSQPELDVGIACLWWKELNLKWIPLHLHETRMKWYLMPDKYITDPKGWNGIFCLINISLTQKHTSWNFWTLSEICCTRVSSQSSNEKTKSDRFWVHCRAGLM